MLVTTLAAFVTIENWRGHRAWRLYAAQQTARGIDLTTLPQPSSLPANGNFMRSPVVERIFAGGRDWAAKQEFSGKYGLKRRAGPSGGAWLEGRMLQLDECIYALAPGPQTKPTQPPAARIPELAERLLALQQPAEGLLQQLRIAARERDESQLVHPSTLNLHDPFSDRVSPYFHYVRETLTAQVWHASASLATGRPEVAFYDALAGLKMLRGLEDAPDALLVDTMIGTAGTGMVMQVVWEGLQGRHWNDSQLAELARELARPDLVASLQRSLHTERVVANLTLDQLGWGDSPVRRAIKESGHKELAKLLYLPSGWIQQNKKSANQWLDTVAEVVGAAPGPDFAARMRRLENVPARFGKPWSPYSYWAITTVTAYNLVVPNVLRQQTMLRLAETACALERYRLAHDRYPDRLAELVPSFLAQVPIDLIDGQSLRYQRDDATGRFALYSIGYDGKDDAGAGRGAYKTTAPGDWIWPQPLEEK